MNLSRNLSRLLLHTGLSLALLGSAPFSQPARAQGGPGSLDPYFATGSGTGAAGTVQSIALQPDGRILVVGDFTVFNGTPCLGVVRLNPNGSLDQTFRFAATGAKYLWFALALQADGKIVLGGVLQDNNTGVRLRLNPDGSVDPSFSLQLDDAFTDAFAFVPAPGGKLYVGGDFTLVNSSKHSFVARLNADSSVDASFNANFPYVVDVFALALQPDGKVIYGGDFEAFSDAPGRIGRFNPDGSRDAAFTASTAPDGAVYCLALQPDGKILLGGAFTDVAANGFPGYYQTGIARLNADGTSDPTFKVSSASGATVYAIALQPDGKILAGGQFTDFNVSGSAATGSDRHVGIVRFNADGSVDSSFDPGGGTDDNGYVNALALQPDGEVSLGGFFAQVNNAARNGLARLSLHPAFFNGEIALGGGVDYLQFPGGAPFGYYSYVSYPIFYHFDLGYENVFDAGDGKNGIYLYDFASQSFFYTSPSFPFPYLYDFTLNATLYYYPDPNNPGHYNTNGVRYFYNFATGRIITK